MLRGFNIEIELVQVIQALYENSNSAVLLNNQRGELLKTTVGVRQGCLHSPVRFNLFVQFMQKTLHNHDTPISIGGRPTSNPRFAGDIDLTGGSNCELQDLTNRFVNGATTYRMEVSTDKSKIMTRPDVRGGDLFQVTGNNSMRV